MHAALRIGVQQVYDSDSLFRNANVNKQRPDSRMAEGVECCFQVNISNIQLVDDACGLTRPVVSQPAEHVQGACTCDRE